MSAPLRFLGLAIISYVGLRTASSALALEPILPLANDKPAPKAVTAEAEAALPPPGVPAEMGPAPYPYPNPAMAYGYGPPGMQGQGPVIMPYPVMPAAYPAARPAQVLYYPAPYRERERDRDRGYPPPALPGTDDAAMGTLSGSAYDQPVAPLDQWPAIGTVGPASVASLQRTPRWGKNTGDSEPIAAARPDRWSVDAWTLLRPPREGVIKLNDPNGGLNPGLASAGSLGGSQAGMRITWRPLQSVGVHVRASTALMPQGRGGQALAGGEGAVGVSWQPFRQIPIRLLGERRQRLGPALGGGRNAFAVLAEGGLYGARLPYGIELDGYGQAGIVGMRRRDLFADGALAATYPFLPRLAIGAGVWGGTQPGLYRVDAGPRLSYQLSPRLRLHLDYRFQMTGNAEPRSGPALTIAGGF